MFSSSPILQLILDRRPIGQLRKAKLSFGGSGIRFTRLAPGTTIPARREDDAEIRYLIDGSMEYAGKTWFGGQTKDVGTYMFIQNGAEVGEITTNTGGLFFVIELPMLAVIEAQRAREASKRESSDAMATAK
jgi:hypothetical protein